MIDGVFSCGDLVISPDPSLGIGVVQGVEIVSSGETIVHTVHVTDVRVDRSWPAASLIVLGRGNFSDVVQFHHKFGLDVDVEPRPLDPETFDYRKKFMQEELDEFESSFAEGDLAGQADALVDLVYVAMGTAHMMGLPWEALWAEVQAANMRKERATGSQDPRSKRKNALDVVKPAGWKPPDIEAVIRRYANVAGDHRTDH